VVKTVVVAPLEVVSTTGMVSGPDVVGAMTGVLMTETVEWVEVAPVESVVV
jgi:hypothetical protein